MSAAFEPMSIELGFSFDVETALEASCGVLMALEAMRSHPDASAAEFVSLQARLAQAIESLRRVIAQLRMARSDAVVPTTLGFVTAAPVPRRPQKRASRRPHSLHEP